MIKQLRPFWSAEELAKLYANRYDHTQWVAHVERIAFTASRLYEMHPTSIADLSCGDGGLVGAARIPVEVPSYLGDITPGHPYTGRIEDTIHQIPDVDVFVCSETLEHVENPEEVLSLIGEKANRLLLTTPHGEMDDRNPEHYWGWDSEGIKYLLDHSGWTGEFELFTPPSDDYYTFQIWRCKNVR